MTGWRIGYTAASREIAKLMGSVQSHQTSNPNSIAQKAAVEALRGSQETVKMMQKEFDRRRMNMYNRLLEMPYIETNLPVGAFYVFVDMSQTLGTLHKGREIDSIETLASILIDQYQVAVIPCADFGFATHIRLSYAISMEQIDKGLDRIETFLKALEPSEQQTCGLEDNAFARAS